MDLVIYATGINTTVVFCQVTIVLFMKYLFNKEIKKKVTGVKTVQTGDMVGLWFKKLKLSWKSMMI